MPSAFQKALTQAMDTIAEIASVSVVYSRGVNSVTIDAVPGRTTVELADENGMLTRSKVRDYKVKSSSLVISGSVVLPERGDTIAETVGSAVYTYEVIGPGPDTHYRESDLAGDYLRIHTRLVGVA